jgi:hypothetical protein
MKRRVFCATIKRERPRPTAVALLSVALVTHSGLVCLTSHWRVQQDKVLFRFNDGPVLPIHQQHTSTTTDDAYAMRSIFARRLETRRDHEGLDHVSENDSLEIQTIQLPNWMNEYFAWHNETLHSLHQNHSSWTEYRYLVVRCLKMDHKCGGASDRLQHVPTFALRLASQYERLLFIEWEKPAPLPEFLEPVSLDWRIPFWLRTSTSGDELNFNDTFQFQRSPTIVSDKHLHRLKRNQDACLIDMRYQTSNHGREYYNSFLQHGEPNFDEIYSAVWACFFRPSAGVQNLIDESAASLGLDLQHSNYVALHARTLYWKDKSHQQDRVHNAVNCAVSKMMESSQRTQIYIASDSPIVAETAIQYGTHQYHLQIVSNNRSSSTPPLHLDRGSNFLSPKDEDSNWMVYDAQLYFSVFVDLYLLSRAQCVGYNIGGYGHWASLISPNRSCQSINYNTMQCDGHSTDSFVSSQS